MVRAKAQSLKRVSRLEGCYRDLAVEINKLHR